MKLPGPIETQLDEPAIAAPEINLAIGTMAQPRALSKTEKAVAAETWIKASIVGKTSVPSVAFYHEYKASCDGQHASEAVFNAIMPKFKAVEGEERQSLGSGSKSSLNDIARTLAAVNAALRTLSNLTGQKRSDVRIQAPFFVSNTALDIIVHLSSASPAREGHSRRWLAIGP